MSPEIRTVSSRAPCVLASWWPSLATSPRPHGRLTALSRFYAFFYGRSPITFSVSVSGPTGPYRFLSYFKYQDRISVPDKRPGGFTGQGRVAASWLPRPVWVLRRSRP